MAKRNKITLDNLTDTKFLQEQYALFNVAMLKHLDSQKQAAEHGESPFFEEGFKNLLKSKTIKEVSFSLFVHDLTLVDFVAWNNRCVFGIVKEMIASQLKS